MSNIIELKDVKPVPDIVQVYPQNVKENHVPLIIDNGLLYKQLNGCN